MESCSVGTPVIAFDAPGGTREIVENGINGFIVRSEEEFMNKLITKKEWNSKIVADSVYKKFGAEQILKKYENLFIEIINS